MNAPQKPIAGALSDALASNDGPQATMTDAIFNDLTKRINGFSGIVFPDEKRQLVESRLRKRLRKLNISNFADYMAYLDGPTGKEEVGHMINVVTTNLTAFFREGHHFSDMIETINADAANNERHHRVRIWSSACSTGEEPYSIAMSLLQAGLITPASDIRVLATDLDTAALAKAKNAIYPEQRLSKCPPGYQKAFCDTLPDEMVKVKSKVQKLVHFNQLNLHEAWPVQGPFDIIFCRNVMIYFGETAKRTIVDRFVKILRPGGKLYLGHSESMLGTHPQLENLGRTIFRKKL